jgi:hypothetical protein
VGQEDPGVGGGLTLVDRLEVHFRGGRGGTGPLTLGQLTTLAWTMNMTLHPGRLVSQIIRLPDGTGLDDIAAAFSVLLARHEALRTAYLAGEAVQRVTRAGVLTIDVYTTTVDTTTVDGVDAAKRLVAAQRERRFELTDELPLRVAVLNHQGAARVLVYTVSHMSVDHTAAALVRRDLMELVADPDSRHVGPRRHQPLDQSAFERSPAGRRRIQAALRHWVEHRRRIPAVVCALPAGSPDEHLPPGITRPGPTLGAHLSSPAAATAILKALARTSGTPSMLLAAAVIALVSRRTGHRFCPLHVVSDNRRGRNLHDYVGTLASDALVVVDTDAPSFDELVRRTGSATLLAHRHHVNDTEAESVASGVIEWQRGVAFQRDFTMNDTSSTVPRPTTAGPPADAPTPSGELHWLTPERCSALLAFQMWRTEPVLDVTLLTGDSRRVPAAEIESLLRGLELLMVAAGKDNVDLDQIGKITGVEPLERGPDWVHVDSCWVELTEAQRLLTDAVRVPARVFAVPDPTGRPELVGYLVAGDRARTPEQAHAACMAILPGRFTAMAPRRYVLCDREPERPAELAAWQALPPLACGDGRLPGAFARPAG